MKHTFDRRQNANITSRTRPDHPERLPPDDAEQNPNLVTTTEAIVLTVTATEERSSFELTTKISTEVDSITTEAELITTIPIDSVVLSNRCSHFYLACRYNNIEEVKKLLEIITHEEIDRIEPNGSTALHAASYHGHREIVKLLLEAGADRAIQNKFKCLPFDEAADNETKELFLRIPNTNRFVWNTGSIEWELVDEDVLEKAMEERQIIQTIYDTVETEKMFEKINKNYIDKGLIYFDGMDNIKRFFRKATEEQDPMWIIKAYTAETEFYKVLNQEIAGGANQYQNERRYIIALLWHHPKLDSLAYTGLSYRVMQVNYDDLQKYQVDCLLMSKSFLSSSIDRQIAELFLCRKESSQETPIRFTRDGRFIKIWIMCIYHIKHRRTALHIENSSQYANEGEVLIMPYTVFKVKNIKHITPSSLPMDHSMTQIEFEECEQFFDKKETDE
jgi:hypothetical protein